MKKYIALAFLICLMPFALASTLKPLPVNQAFQLSTTVGTFDSLVVHFKIAKDYHLYRGQMAFKLVKPNSAKLATVTLPAGIPKQDAIFGKYQAYYNSVNIPLQVNSLKGKSAKIQVNYQGCADSGFCYPPQKKLLTINFKGGTVSQGQAPQASMVSEQGKITQMLEQKSIWLVLLIFLGFGFLLAFTPCVLPMLPILSGIIVGEGENIKTTRAFGLSLAYVIGMAITFAIAGVVAGLVGSSIQTAFQQPWVIIVFSIVFLLLALSLFGFYELQLPAFIRERANNISGQQKAGSYIGVAVMGALATLIVSPCVSAPLIGALAYIGKTGDAVLGGFALLFMGFGMGIPLLVFGTLEGKFLPKAGPWMHHVKVFFGVLLLAVALWLLERIFPGALMMFMWAGLLIVYSIYIGAFTIPETDWHRFWKGVGLVIFVFGVLLMIGGSLGNTDPLQPLRLPSNLFHSGAVAPRANGLFQKIENVTELQQALDKAKAAGKPVLVDFYADWCIACKTMEHNVFATVEVQKQLQGYVLLQADITKDNVANKALMKRFNVIAPPDFIFFNGQGKQLTSARIVGEMSKQAFLQHLSKIKTSVSQ